jgi:CDP-paratose 2-epimerase
MIGGAAYWAKQRGKKTVLAGTCPTDCNWLRLMFERGVMNFIDVVGIHGFPGSWEFDWEEWDSKVNEVQELLDRYHSPAEIWVTETGYSTWRHDEHKQIQSFNKAIDLPVNRVYWYSLHDLHPDLPHTEAFHGDERHYHFGLKRAKRNPKIAFSRPGRRRRGRGSQGGQAP